MLCSLRNLKVSRSVECVVVGDIFDQKYENCSNKECNNINLSEDEDCICNK